MKHKIMVLGGGSSQLALLQRCKTAGMEVILADRDPKARAENTRTVLLK